MIMQRLQGLTDALGRYPLTSAFLAASAIINALNINDYSLNYEKFIVTFVVGAFLGAVAQAIFERFFTKQHHRIALSALAALLTGGYYFIISAAPEFSVEIGLRTSIALFALLISFILVPSLKNKTSFNQSFMISFKSFFVALFFSLVIMLGMSLIIGAIDQLLFRVSYRAIAHTANIIFTLFGTLYFLSLVPLYHKESEEQIAEAASTPKFLEILISYIIIPLTAVFTVILLIYIFLNIGGQFWTDNLLEPMLVSYSIIVILVYILASSLSNKFANLYRKIFPKILVPIVIFQIISSVLSLGDTGVTLGRYFTILYGVFAATTGVILSIVPLRKNGLVAILLIAFSIVSIVPPTDAFTISRNSQLRIVEETLISNDMLADDTVMPDATISEEDKDRIRTGMRNLQNLGYIERISWLPEDFNYYRDFSDTFGFSEYERADHMRDFTFVNLDSQEPISISGYDFMLSQYRVSNREEAEGIVTTFTKGELDYTIEEIRNAEQEVTLVLYEDPENELLRFNTQDIFEFFMDFEDTNNMIPPEIATFSAESDEAILTAIIQDLHIDKSSNETRQNATMYLLIRVK